MSTMETELKAKSIELPNHELGEHIIDCPRCAASAKKKTGKTLRVTIMHVDLASWKCRGCMWQGQAGNVAKYAAQLQIESETHAKPVRQSVAVEDEKLPEDVIEYFTTRGISEEVLVRNKIYFENEEICFPYYVGAEVVNVKYVGLETREKRMTKDAELVFFGLNDVKGKSEIIITADEMDKLSLEMCGYTNVISVPNGAREEYKHGDQHLSYLAHAHEQLAAAKKVVIATKNTPAGDALRFEIARRIGLKKCWSVEWPEDCRDASQAFVKLDVEVVAKLVSDAKAFPVKGLYEVRDFTAALQEFFNGAMKSGVSTGFECLDELWTIMVGELIVFTGVPNSGKSELIDAILVNLAKFEAWCVAIFSPENGKEQHVVKLAEKVMGITTNPKAKDRMTTDQLMQGAAWVGQYFYFIVADDDENLPTIEWLLDKADIAVLRYGIKVLVIDPWNEVEHDRPATQTEGEYVSKVLSRLKRWARNHAVAVWIVAHPTKMSVDKDGNTLVPGLYNISGSANWTNKPDGGIVVHREKSEAYEKSGITKVYVKKVRQKHVGRIGETALKYDRTTGTYKPAIDKAQEAIAREQERDADYDGGVTTYEHDVGYHGGYQEEPSFL